MKKFIFGVLMLSGMLWALSMENLVLFVVIPIVLGPFVEGKK